MKRASDVRKALCYAALMEDGGVVCTIGGQSYMVKRRKNYDYGSDKKPVAFYQTVSPNARVELDYDQFEKQVDKYAREWMKTPYVRSGNRYLEISDYGINELEVSDVIRNVAGYDVPNDLIKNEQDDNAAHEKFLERNSDLAL